MNVLVQLYENTKQHATRDEIVTNEKDVRLVRRVIGFSV